MGHHPSYGVGQTSTIHLLQKGQAVLEFGTIEHALMKTNWLSDDRRFHKLLVAAICAALSTFPQLLLQLQNLS
eukprot:5129621-Karenia_brevis.AAC.1